MDMEEVYRIIKYLRLSEDDNQDIAIKVWEAQDTFNPEIASLSAWVTKIAKNYVISKSRSTQYKDEQMINYLDYYSFFDEQGNEVNRIDHLITSNELSPIDKMIQTEEREILLNRLESLPNDFRDILKDYLNGVCDSSPLGRSRLFRAKQAFFEGKTKNEGRKKEYLLINLQDSTEYTVGTLKEAAKIAGVTHAGISYAYKNSSFFRKNTWKITNK